MDRKSIELLKNIYGDRWILRDLDFFPEKLSDAARVYPYSTDTYITAIENKHFFSFATEREAIEASIKIYETLKRKVPYGLLERYYLATSKK